MLKPRIYAAKLVHFANQPNHIFTAVVTKAKDKKDVGKGIRLVFGQKMGRGPHRTNYKP